MATPVSFTPAMSNRAGSDLGGHGTFPFSDGSIRLRRFRYTWSRWSWQLGVCLPPACWRALEFSLALGLGLLFLPLLGLLYLIAKARGGGIERTIRMGENAREFEEYSFCFGSTPAASAKSLWRAAAPASLLQAAKRLPALANVLLASMSLVGPRTLSRHQISFDDRSAWKRFAVPPGLIGLWWLRRQSNIDYLREAAIDAEYIDRRSFRTDLGILLRSIPAAFYGAPVAAATPKVEILGVPIDNISMAEAVETIASCHSQARSFRVSFVNADCINSAQRDSSYAAALRSADLVLADGIGVKLAGNLLRTPIRQNVNGTDLLPRLCARLAEQASSVYLLGGRPGVAKEVAAWIRRSYPGLAVVGCQDGYFPERQTEAVLQTIRAAQAKVLLVAMGAPKQEKWIRDYAAAAQVPVAIGVGGLFDFYSGRAPRAPQWVRELGMEWLFRLCQEPGRLWKRYLLGNLVFAARVLRARLRQKKALARARWL